MTTSLALPTGSLHAFIRVTTDAQSVLRRYNMFLQSKTGPIIVTMVREAVPNRERSSSSILDDDDDDDDQPAPTASMWHVKSQSV